MRVGTDKRTEPQQTQGQSPLTHRASTTGFWKKIIKRTRAGKRQEAALWVVQAWRTGAATDAAKALKLPLYLAPLGAEAHTSGEGQPAPPPMGTWEKGVNTGPLLPGGGSEQG